MDFTHHFEAPLSPIAPLNSVQPPSVQTPSDSTASTQKMPFQKTPFPEQPAEKTRVYERLAHSLNHSLWNRLKSTNDTEENESSSV